RNPVQHEVYAPKGWETMENKLIVVLRSRRSELPWRIVPTLCDRRTRASVDSLRELRATYGDKVWPSAIPVDTQFREASRQGLPLTIAQPWARGSQAYRRLLQELLQENDAAARQGGGRSEEHTSELQSRENLVCRLLH